MSDNPEFEVSCRNCKHAQVIASDVTKMECRRYPPQVHLVNGPRGPGQMVCFPIVEGKLRCGEFQLKLSLAS